jgi:importin subunit alpha-6/7
MDGLASRRANFKKVIGEAEARKARAQVNNDVRKNKLMEAHMKRRNIAGAAAGEPEAAAPPTAPSNLPTAARPAVKGADVANLATYVAGKRLEEFAWHLLPDVARGLIICCCVIVPEIMTENPDTQFHGVQEIRKLLSRERDPPVLPVLQANILPRLVYFLANGNEKMQFEASWAITNVASTDYTHAVVEAGAIPVLTNLLRSQSPEVREQCAWCLGNITGDGASFRDMVLNTPGAIESLMLNIQYPHNESLLRNVGWTLSNCCRGKPAPKLEVVAPMIPAFVHLLGATDAEILGDAAWGLSYITDGDETRIQAVVDCGAVPRLAVLLNHSSNNVVIPALRTLGNIVTGNDVQTQSVIDAGVLASFARLARHERRNIRREACWAASNVAAGTPAQVAALVGTPGMVEALLHCADKGEWAVRKEAAWAVSNAITTGGQQVVLYLVACGAIGPLVRLLNVDDAKIIMVALDALSTILDTDAEPGKTHHTVLIEEAGGCTALEELQTHSSKDVYNKAVEIIDTHFSEEEGEENTTAVVETANGGKTFAFGMPAVATNPFGAPQPAAFGGFGFLTQQQPAFTM